MQSICCGGYIVKIWCNSPLWILWGRKGKPTDGVDSLRWCVEHTVIYRGRGRPVAGGQPITWGNQQNWTTYGGTHPTPSNHTHTHTYMHIPKLYRNWDNIYVWGLLVLPFIENPIPTNWYFVLFCLVCKLFEFYR